jgi:arabinogalactan oligomer / maltooligosaccharide transport system permease protein
MIRGAATRLRLFAALLVLCSTSTALADEKVTLWHSYTGRERDALHMALDAFAKTKPGFTVDVSAVPYDALVDKLSAAIPRGHGPDVFIFAHDRIGGWAEGGLLAPIELMVDEPMLDAHATPCVFALAYRDSLYGLPLAHKSLALYVRTDRIKSPPATFDELLAAAKSETDPSKGRFGLVYPNADLFFHTPLLFSLGGDVLDKERSPAVINDGLIASLALARRLAKEEKVLPDDPSPVTGSAMFSDGRTPMVISGPWFRSQIDRGVPYTVTPIPAFPGGKRSSGFATCEGVLMNGKTTKTREAFKLMHFLANDLESARARMAVGAQPVTLLEAWDKVLPELPVEEQKIFRAFEQAFAAAVTSPSEPAMAAVWTPMNAALYKTIHQGMAPEDAAKEAQKRIEDSLTSSRKGAR